MPPVRIRRLAMLSGLLLAWTAAAAAQTPAQATPAGNSFQALVESAKSARDSGNAAEAIRDYSRAVTLRPNFAEGWWNLGIIQYESNQYPDAVTSLRKLVALVPNSAAGWSILGLAQFETKNYADALTSLQTAQTLGGIRDPDIAHVSAYHLALLLIRSGQFEKAVALMQSELGETDSLQVKIAHGLAVLRIPLLPSEVDPSQDALIQATGDAWSSLSPNAVPQLLQQYPSTPWLHYSYGLDLASKHRIQDALSQLRLETVLSPASPLPWIEIDRLQKQLGHTQQALTAASKVAHLAPPAARDPRMIALYGLHSPSAEGSAGWDAAMQSYAQGRYHQAVTALKAWVEQNPSDGTAWAVLGLSEFALKDYGNALIHLQRGINLGVKGSAQSVTLARYRLALLLIRNHQFDAASSLLKPVAGQTQYADQIKTALGLALLRIPELPGNLNTGQPDLAHSAGAIVELLFASRYAQAFAEFQKLIAQHPITPWLHYAYGDALDSLSQYNDARAQMRAEIKLSPQSPLPWIRLAAIAIRQHNAPDALDAAQNAVRIAPASAEAHYQLGRAWLESGDAKNSIAELQKANALRSDNPEIHFALARAYAKAGLAQQAAAERTAFMQLKALAADSQHSGAPQSILQSNSQPPQN
jgi:tetratricopeptide (TPR) repeat protein